MAPQKEGLGYNPCGDLVPCHHDVHSGEEMESQLLIASVLQQNICLPFLVASLLTPRKALQEFKRSSEPMFRLQVLAYKQVDVEHRGQHIRVLHTEHTIRELRQDFSQWANASISPHCMDVLKNITAEDPDIGNIAKRIQTSQAQQSELTNCLQAASKNFGSLTSILLSGAQKFIDRNG